MYGKIFSKLVISTIAILLVLTHLTTITLAFNNLSPSRDEGVNFTGNLEPQKELTLPIQHSFLHDNLNAWFNISAEYNNYIVADEDSVQLIVGVDYSIPWAYNSIAEEFIRNRGKIVSTMSIEGKVIAVVVNLPLEKFPRLRDV